MGKPAAAERLTPPPEAGRRRFVVARAVLLAALVAATASCGSSRKAAEDARSACPEAGVLESAGQQTRFRTPGGTRGDALYEARIVGVSAEGCRADRSGGTIVDLRIALQLVRGPAATEESFAVTYFVAVTDPAGAIVSRKPFTVEFRVPADRTGGNLQEELSVTVPQSAGSSGGSSAGYRIYAALQLTPEELEYNRTTGAR